MPSEWHPENDEGADQDVDDFPDEETEHAHMNSPWLAEAAPGIVDCLEGTWVREYLDPLP